MSLIREFSNNMSNQVALSKSDGSDAGKYDVAGKAKTGEVKFNLMRNTINSDGKITGSDVANYLEKAGDINDEVDTVLYGLETDDGKVVKVYVNAAQAEPFEAEMKKMLGMEDDVEKAINDLATKFDIVDVVWPKGEGPEGEEEEGTDDVDLDAVSDLGSDEDTTPPEGENDMEEIARTDNEIPPEENTPSDGGTPQGDEAAGEETPPEEEEAPKKPKKPRKPKAKKPEEGEEGETPPEEGGEEEAPAEPEAGEEEKPKKPKKKPAAGSDKDKMKSLGASLRAEGLEPLSLFKSIINEVAPTGTVSNTTTADTPAATTAPEVSDGYEDLIHKLVIALGIPVDLLNRPNVKIGMQKAALRERSARANVIPRVKFILDQLSKNGA